jgi:hypothetical protein
VVLGSRVGGLIEGGVEVVLGTCNVWFGLRQICPYCRI